MELLKKFGKKVVFACLTAGRVLTALVLTVVLWACFALSEKIADFPIFFQAGLLGSSVLESGLPKPDFLVGLEPEDEQIKPAESSVGQDIQAGSSNPLFKEGSVEDQLDDIAERIDVIQAQVQELMAKKDPEFEVAEESEEIEEEVVEEQETEEPEEDEAENNEQNQETVKIAKTSSGAKTTYPKLLISEVLVGAENDSKQEFIELFNQNDTDVELTGWYLQRKTENGTSWSTYASKNLFGGKTIFANGYFLIARTDYYAGLADIFTDSSITDNNSFALKDPNGDISDKLGFGLANDPELLPALAPGAGQSTGRKILEDGSEWDTDINFYDFELQNPTPKMPNVVYVAPVVPVDPAEPIEPPAEESCVGQIDINTSSLEQLDEITGIGPVYAQRIIDARPFTSLDDLLGVEGIGEVTLEKIKEQGCAFVEPLPQEPQDATPPEVVFMLDALQSQLNFAVNFEIADPLDTVTPSGLANYIFRWQEGGPVDDGWQEDPAVEIDDVPEFYTAQREFEADVPAGEAKTYYFQINASDMAGNWSDWMPEIPAFTTVSGPDLPIVVIPKVKPIVINEVQVGGQTAKDEFIELYNPNDFAVDISGYALKKKTSGGTESNLVSSGAFSGIIPACGYFLITPQVNDDGTPNYMGVATPDLYYSGKTYSIASNNTVLLYDAESSLIDKVGFGDAQDFETAAAGNPLDGQSITRTGGLDTDDNSADFVVSDAPTPGM